VPEIDVGTVVARHVEVEHAADVIAGYTIANDLVVRDYVTNLFRPPLRGKCWDTFCPIGPYLVEGEVDDPNALALRAFVNGELRQSGSTAGMLRKIPELIEYICEENNKDPQHIVGK